MSNSSLRVGLVLPLFVSVVLSVALFAAPRVSQAAIPDSILALAGPLAEQFGVPGSAVTSLLQSGISLESVTQLLLVTQASGKGLDQVTDLFREQGDDVQQAADQLGVAAEKYSSASVDAAIDRAKADVANAAAAKAADSAGKAVGSLLGGKR